MLTVNSSLKRLFLSSTGLTTEGAIALAEVVPESRGLIHLDLTSNPSVELAGVMAIAAALRSNKVMRCLDLTIPPNNPQMAELSQAILQSCISNTESALSSNQAAQSAIWAPIQKSTLVRQAKEAEQAKAIAAAQEAVETPAGHARREVYELKPDALLRACEEGAQALLTYISNGVDAPFAAIDEQNEVLLIEQSKVLVERVGDLIQETSEPARLERLLSLNDILLPQISQAEELLAARKQKAQKRPTIQIKSNSPEAPKPRRTGSGTGIGRHIPLASLHLDSPNFSIADSDDEDDSDPEELSPVRTPVVKARLNSRSSEATNDPNVHGLGLGDLTQREDSSVVQEPETCSSPMKEANKDWIAEEGEIFRKGQKLGLAEEEEDEEDADVSGQELKQKVGCATSSLIVPVCSLD